MSGLLVASPSEAFDHKLAGVFDGELNGHRRYWRPGLLDETPETVVAELTRSGPDVVALGPDMPVARALDLARVFDATRPDVVVLLVAEPNLPLFELALRTGVRDVVAPEGADGEMREAFDRALDAAGRRRSVLTTAASTGPSRHVICVVSPKGGTGKTTVSTNLAVGLAREHPGEVVIVDLDFQFGDVASVLRLAPDHTFTDITRTPLTVDATTVKIFLTPHPSELYVLCAPSSPVEADDITTRQVQHVISLLASEFRYVVIDTGSGLDEATLSVLNLCTDILCLTSTDVPSVRATRKEVQTLDLLGVTAPARHFVVNRADARVGLSLADIEETVGLRAHVAIPSSRAVPLSVNQGVPVVASDPRSPVGDAMTLLVGRFSGVPVDGRDRRRDRRKKRKDER